MAAVTYLFDTNIFLELLLDRERAGEVRQLFLTLDPSEYAISDLSLHSIGVILTRMRKHDLLIEFIDDMIIEAGMRIVGIPSTSLAEMVTGVLRHSLDFDDAYQVAAVERYSMRLVSFDRDFDATPITRIEPVDILSRTS